MKSLASQPYYRAKRKESSNSGEQTDQTKQPDQPDPHPVRGEDYLFLSVLFFICLVLGIFGLIWYGMDPYLVRGEIEVQLVGNPTEWGAFQHLLLVVNSPFTSQYAGQPNVIIEPMNSSLSLLKNFQQRRHISCGYYSNYSTAPSPWNLWPQAGRLLCPDPSQETAEVYGRWRWSLGRQELRQFLTLLEEERQRCDPYHPLFIASKEGTNTSCTYMALGIGAPNDASWLTGFLNRFWAGLTDHHDSPDSDSRPGLLEGLSPQGQAFSFPHYFHTLSGEPTVP